MLLPYLILIPFLGGILCWQSERFCNILPKFIALFSIGIILFFSIVLWKQCSLSINLQNEYIKWQIEYLRPWIPRFGIDMHLALDGLSLLMIVLTGLLGVLSVLCSWSEIKHYQGIFYFNILWILGSVVGVFLSIDLFLFFFFWEIMIIPMYFLISLWGNKDTDIESKNRITAATKFFIYSQVSGLIMLVAILGLVFVHYNNTGIWTFNYSVLLSTSMSKNIEYLLMLGFFLAFSIKMPIVPLHGWLPDAHTQAPTAGSVELAGLLLKTSAYGLLRFSLPLFPYASQQFSTIAIVIGVITIFYGALIAFSQTDIKRIMAYSSISHMGFLLIAIYSGNFLAYQGAIIEIISYALSSSGMFIICGQLYERLHTRDIRLMGGLWGRLNFIPAISLFFSMAIIGIPGTGNFIGEFTILLGSFSVIPKTVIIATFSLIVSSIYSLSIIQRAYYGFGKSNEFLKSITFREKFITMVIVILLIIIGLFPKIIIDTSYAAIQNIHDRFILRAINYNTSILITR